MKAKNAMLTALVALCSVQLGWLLSGWLAPDARADDPIAVTLDPPEAGSTDLYPGRLLCKTFAVDPDDASMELPGDTSAAGRWARDQSERWQIYTVDLEIGQKPNGYPQQWMQVCLYPR